MSKQSAQTSSSSHENISSPSSNIKRHCPQYAAYSFLLFKRISPDKIFYAIALSILDITRFCITCQVFSFSPAKKFSGTVLIQYQYCRCSCAIRGYSRGKYSQTASFLVQCDGFLCIIFITSHNCIFRPQGIEFEKWGMCFP